MTDRTRPRIAIIGAGMAGLSAAAYLADTGLRVVVLEKSRGIGGRIATRRTPDNLHFDHGAQYFTAATPDFQDFTSEQMLAGNLADWSPVGRPETARSSWLVGTPAMNTFLKPIAGRVQVDLGAQVTAITPSGKGWAVHLDGREAAKTFDAVIVTAPAPQASALTVASPRLQQQLAGVEMAPCWALMLAVNAPETARRAVFDNPHPDIAWMARNASKPGRSPAPETWIIHASTAYSTAQLEADADAVAAELLQVAIPLAGYRGHEVIHARAHRWRYARTLQAAGTPFLAGETGTLLAAGDWCLGARVESAFQSGRAAAEFLSVRLASKAW